MLPLEYFEVVAAESEGLLVELLIIDVILIGLRVLAVVELEMESFEELDEIFCLGPIGGDVYLATGITGRGKNSHAIVTK
jgi:hypothetical protein